MQLLKKCLLVFILIGSANLAYANQCRELFEKTDLLSLIQGQTDSLDKISKQQFLESAILFFQRKITASSIRSTTATEQRNKLNLIHFLKAGKVKEATDIYRHIFEHVELSFWMIPKFTQHLQDLKALPDSPENQKAIHAAKVKLGQFEKRFAENYGEYTTIRAYLEGLIAEQTESPLFLEAAKTTLRYLGVHKYSEVYKDYASLEIPQERAELKDIKTLYRSSSHYTRLKLWKDFRKEITAALQYIFSSEILSQNLERVIDRLPVTANIKFKVKSVLGFLHSARLRLRLMPKFVEIENLPEEGYVRLEELRKKNTTSPHDEFLITFARTTEFSDLWISLKAQAKKKSEETGSSIYENFYTRMETAEQKSLTLGNLSLFEKSPGIDVTLALIEVGILLKLTVPENIPSIVDVFNLFAKTIGG